MAIREFVGAVGDFQAPVWPVRLDAREQWLNIVETTGQMCIRDRS